jgi:peptide/nickel transport system substrate-binding protein
MLGASVPWLQRWAKGPLSTEAATPTSDVPRRGGILRATTVFPAQIEPQLVTNIAGSAGVQPVMEQLVRVGADVIPRPHLAESWTASDDAKTWTFKIRRGVTFNNGARFSADDVVWTFAFLLDPKTASTARSTLPYLTPSGVEKIDDYTVRFHLNRSVATFPADLSNYMIVILPKDWPGDFRKNPIGTGPFKLTELVLGDHASYTRNPTYWRQPIPYVDGMELIFTRSATTEIDMLLAGHSHVMVAVSQPSQIPAHKITLLTAKSAWHHPVYWRTDMKPFSDPRVGQALKYVVNREEMVKIVYHGTGVTGNDHPVAPVYPEWTDNGTRKQDYAKARALLSAAGYPNGLSLDVYSMSDSGPLEGPTAVAFQRMAAPAGIKVQLRLEPSTVLFKHWTEVPVGVINWVMRPAANAVLDLAFRCGVPWNAGHWCDHALDTMLDELDATVELDKRRAATRRIEDKLTEDGPAIIWGFHNVFRALRPNVRGIIASPISHVDLEEAWFAGS